MSAKSIIILGIKNILILLIPAFIYFILTITRLDFIIYYYLSDTGIRYEELYGSLMFLMYLFVLLHYITKTISLFKQSQGFLSRIKILFFCLIIPVFMGFFIGASSYFLIAGEDHFRRFESTVNGYVYIGYPNNSVLTRTGKVLWQKKAYPFDVFMFQSVNDGEEYLCVVYKDYEENNNVIRFDVVSPEEAKIMAIIKVEIDNDKVDFSDVSIDDDKNEIKNFINNKISQYKELREEKIGPLLFSIYFEEIEICSDSDQEINYITNYSNWKVISDYKNIIGKLNHSEDNHFIESDSNHNEDDSETEESTSKIVVEHHGATQKWVPCNICNGSMECQTCHGLGYTGFTYQSECVTCNGFKKCTYCSGQGGHYETVYY